MGNEAPPAFPELGRHVKGAVTSLNNWLRHNVADDTREDGRFAGLDAEDLGGYANLVGWMLEHVARVAGKVDEYRRGSRCRRLRFGRLRQLIQAVVRSPGLR